MVKSMFAIILSLVMVGAMFGCAANDTGSNDEGNGSTGNSTEGSATGSQGSAPDTTAPETVVKGSKAPDFRYADLDGLMFNLSDLEGEVVILNFWATWCGYCLQEFPDLQ